MDKLRIILVGAGRWGRGWLARFAASEAWDLVAVVDRDEEAHRRVREALAPDVPPCFFSLGDALAFGVVADAAHIAVSSPFHAALCTESLEAGLHTSVDKPFVTDFEDGVRLAELADRVGRLLVVQQNYRYLPQVQALRDEIAGGHCGPPGLGTVQFFLRHAGQPYQHAMPHVNGLEMAVHHFDMMRYILGATPVSVLARESNPPWSWYDHGASIQAIWTFPGDYHLSYTSTFVTAGQQAPWEGTWRLDCERATLILDDPGQGFGAYRMTPEGCELLCLQANEGMGTEGAIREFAAAIHGGRQPLTSARDNLETMAMVFAAARSSATGKAVELADIMSVRDNGKKGARGRD